MIRSMPTGATSTRSRSGAATGMRVELMLYAGNGLGRARAIFESTLKRRTTAPARPQGSYLGDCEPPTTASTAPS